MSDFYLLHFNREPLWYLGIFSEAVAQQLKELLADNHRYELRAITPKNELPGLSKFEAKLQMSDGAVVEVNAIPAEIASSISWQSFERKFVFGRGFTEAEAVQKAQENRNEYLFGEPDDDDA